MGMYFMCPACKAVNGPCKAENCDEVIEAIARAPLVKKGGRYYTYGPIPKLRYPPTLWQRVKAWWNETRKTG